MRLHCLSTAHHAPHSWGSPTHECQGFDASDEFASQAHADLFLMAARLPEGDLKEQVIALASIDPPKER